ncbi:MAG: hypothetical protein DRJ08_06405 [Acidobacteria bacterium]|nr:MAG: hypothetical protein DRJ08_06405 [Acidobacteriota bacterium]
MAGPAIRNTKAAPRGGLNPVTGQKGVNYPGKKESKKQKERHFIKKKNSFDNKPFQQIQNHLRTLPYK